MLSLSEMEAAAETSFHVNCFLYSYQTMFYYEYLITLGHEIELVWRRKVNGATVLFILNRYVTLVYLLLLAQDWPCGSIYATAGNIIDALKCVMYAILAVFSALRVYAIRDRSLPFGLAVLTLGLVPFATNVYNFSHLHEMNFPANGGCIFVSDVPVPEQKRFVIATRVALMLLTVLVMAATLLTTLGLSRTAGKAALWHVPLVTMILRDGSIYFATLSVLNALQVALTVTGTFSYTADYIDVFASVLMSRFFLNLRQLHEAMDAPGAGAAEAETGTGLWMGAALTTQVRSALVQRVVGNLGAPLCASFGVLAGDGGAWDARVGLGVGPARAEEEEGAALPAHKSPRPRSLDLDDYY